MLVVEMLALGLIATMRLAPETDIARRLHRRLVELPTRWAATLERHQLIYLLLLLAMVFAAGEVIAIVGSADVALGFAWDLSIYFDAVAVTAAVAGARYARTATQLARARLREGEQKRRKRPVRRERRCRPNRCQTASANDDKPARGTAAVA